MQKFLVAELIPHPMNAFYFDDMDGQKWVEFLESVRTSGVIEPPVVTGERVIVSGHQRIRACRELGIDEVNCEVRIYDSDDKVIKDLIETNIRQRGTIAGSELKMGRVWDELKRIYDVKRGKPNVNLRNSEIKTTSEIANMMGKSVSTLEEYAQLKNLIPEFKDILDAKQISPITASRLISRLSEEEQMQLLSQLPAAQKLTQSQVQAEVDKLKSKYDEQVADLEDRLIEAQSSSDDLSIPGEDKQDNYDPEYVRLSQELEEAHRRERKEMERKEAAMKQAKAIQQELNETTARMEKHVREKAQLQEKLDAQSTHPDNSAAESERVKRLELALRKANERIVDLQNPKGNSTDPKIMRVIEGGYTPEQTAADDAESLHESLSELVMATAPLCVDKSICTLMPDRFQELIIQQGEALIKNLKTIFTYFTEGDKVVCKTA